MLLKHLDLGGFSIPIVIAETVNEVIRLIADDEKLILLKTQGLGNKPCLFIEKTFSEINLGIIEQLKTVTILYSLNDLARRRLLNKSSINNATKMLCYEVDDDFISKLTQRGFEEAVWEAKTNIPQGLMVAPI